MGKKQGARHGFLLTAVGSAVGLGNIWGFPYKMGMNGGFAFLLVYLVLAAVVGITVVTAELAIGRSTGRRPVNAYKRLSPGASWLGYLTLTASFIVLGFYSVLGGIVTRHAVSYLTSVFGYNTWGAYTAAGFLNRFLVNGEGMALWTAIFILISTAVLTVGARENVEKFCRVGMPALLTVFIALTVYTALQPGAYDGFRFMFSWNIEPLRENFLGVLSSAAGQLLLSLSLGLGILITYGSFLEKKEKLQRSSAVIVICDTAVAVLSGVLVIPACFAFMDGDISFDPCLLFNSVQEIFLRMDYFGTVMGFVFYALVLSAALSSTVSVMDVIASAMADMDIAKNRAPRRRKAILVCCALTLALSLPAAFEGIGTAGGKSAGLLGIYDTLSTGVLMPLVTGVMSVALGWLWKPGLAEDECELSGTGFRGRALFSLCCRVVVPLLMLLTVAGQALKIS